MLNENITPYAKELVEDIGKWLSSIFIIFNNFS
jgi:hypothetical protein